MAVMDSGLIAEPVIGPRFARTRWRCPGMTIEEKFSFGINLICPVQSHLQKYSASRLTQIKTITRAVPAHSRGVSRSSRTLGTGCGGRGSVGRADVIAGRVFP